MKKLFFVCLIFLVFIYLGFQFIKSRVRTDLSQPVTVPLVTPSPTIVPHKNVSQTDNAIFVPYWAVDKKQLAVSGYNQVIYFGVAASGSGDLQQDVGLATIKQFVSDVSGDPQTILTLRMITSDTDFTILKSLPKQQTLIDQTITTAKQNGFDGIVLDLELSALPFDSVVTQINDFVSRFSLTAKRKNLGFSMLIYGDTFYRLRPFDIRTLGKSVDQLLVMSYDFSKANGDPGPNFPLRGQDIYGYDLQKMFTDFSQAVSPDKLTIILGRFGYDWEVDSKGHGIQTATPLTDDQIQTRFLSGCSYKDCVIHQDTTSSETEVTYTDDAGQKHVVWFEDARSVAAKEKALKELGITHYGDWAYSYF